MSLFAIDVSQAFMNAPLEKHHVVVRLPTSVSRDNDANEPVYLEAKKGLNGLRVGSLAWASFFARIVREAGVESSVTEPCLYAGSVGGAPVVLICYVDDVLVATPKEASYKIVFDLLAKHVKIRETGRIPLASAKDGSLRFLGWTISRKAGDAALYLSVDPDYMISWMNVSVSSESRKGAPRSLTSGQPSRRRLKCRGACTVQENPGSSVADLPNQVGSVGPCRFALHGPGISKARS